MNSKTNIEQTASVMVWDPLVRLFHWCLVVGFFTAYFADGSWMSAHIWAGYLITVWVAIRVIWGFVGTQHARFKDFVVAPSTVMSYLKQVLSLKAKRYIGHNPAGGAMIVLLLILVFTTTVSGMMFYGADAWLGPLAGFMKNVDDSTAKTLKTLHEFSANATVLLVTIHVVGVIWESVLHRENLVKSMINGQKREH